ncbi:MalY/PatB family protein [Puniceicoccus vermicola]|uniref:cysteine-S-conjugate beta-lyase n=1 Tax=Puniceicoccus vermicola TaxID=388746 RepID=A0A7X1AUV2_9BACT|nr:PatB family C-S lyase [Puniceicoccus vermicola]MBC2600443.1 putative C-S lyase [Puniceicoccus vermicola]
MTYDFTTFPDRAKTGSLKWDRYAGKEVLPLWVADMDFRSAPEILTALHERVDHEIFGYTIPHQEPIDAVLSYLKTRHNLEVSAESLVWLPGLVPALNLAARAFCNDGGSVITSTPVYPPFLSAPKNADVPLNAVPLLREGDRWAMDFDQLEKQPAGGTFFLCNPHNPVGTCFPEKDIRRLLELCREKNWILCSDEIHCDLVLDESAKHIPTLTLSDNEKDQVVSLYAPSKTYNLPGLATAFAVIPGTRLRAQFKRQIMGIITEINCFGYAGCAAAYNHGEPWRQELLSVLRTNRDRVYQFFADKSDRVKIFPMEATYLAWFDCGQLPVKDPAQFFEEFGVGLSDGAPFGAPGWLRLNFGCPSATLEEGLKRMQQAFDSL